jgi:hypothetical protein
MARRPGPPTPVALLLGIAILAIAVWGGYAGADIQPAEGCFEACGMESWIAIGFAVVFGGSALFNLLLLIVAVARPASAAAPRSLRSVVVSQAALIACGLVWVVAILLNLSPLGLLAGIGIIGGSLAVCIFTGIVLSAMNPPVATVSR